MSAPSFAIVITAYEAAATIGAAVDSALAQTRPAEEVIVVDDGSRDDLAAALAPYGDRVTMVRRENGGGAAARNTGAEAARSEFMAILDADDTYEPRRLEAIAALAEERTELDLIATDASFVVDGAKKGTFLEHNPFPRTDQRRAIFERCFPTGWPAVRISALREAGGFDPGMRIAYDWDCWLRMILAGSEVGMVEEPLYNYILHGGSLASSRLASLRERVALLEKARGNPNLRLEERPALEHYLGVYREQVARGTIEAALHGEGSREELARLARSRDLGLRTRALAGLATAVPSLARRLAPSTPPPEERFGASD